MHHSLLVRSSRSSPGLGTRFAIPGNDGMHLKVFLTEQAHCKRSVRTKKEVQKMVVRSQVQLRVSPSQRAGDSQKLQRSHL